MQWWHFQALRRIVSRSSSAVSSTMAFDPSRFDAASKEDGRTYRAWATQEYTKVRPSCGMTRGSPAQQARPANGMCVSCTGVQVQAPARAPWRPRRNPGGRYAPKPAARLSTSKIAPSMHSVVCLQWRPETSTEAANLLDGLAPSSVHFCAAHELVKAKLEFASRVVVPTRLGDNRLQAMLSPGWTPAEADVKAPWDQQGGKQRARGETMRFPFPFPSGGGQGVHGQGTLRNGTCTFCMGLVPMGPAE
jgi:hypothetical protein